MVTDQQVRRLFKLVQQEKNFGIAAMKAGLDEKTARKYRDLGKLPSELKQEHTWRTRQDPFEEVWDEIKIILETNPGLEAKTIFEDLQRRNPGQFPDGQIRTLQRRVKVWLPNLRARSLVTLGCFSKVNSLPHKSVRSYITGPNNPPNHLPTPSALSM